MVAISMKTKSVKSFQTLELKTSVIANINLRLSETLVKVCKAQLHLFLSFLANLDQAWCQAGQEAVLSKVSPGNGDLFHSKLSMLFEN